MFETAVFLIFPFCMVFAAVSDLISMTITNRVSLTLVGAFFILAILSGMPLSEIGMHVLAGSAILLVTFTLFALGAMGGGDAKLMASTALWFGFDLALVNYLATAAVLGGLLTLAILRFRHSTLATLAANNILLRHCADAKAGIPYGVALGIGGLITYTQTPLAQWALERIAAS
ncbi:prepilin peptidase [Chelativorans composti]|jgi:Flp pilus assembly protein, protease CpaA|uniref:Prepilin peptidase n=1 Tax=Chelativorans composti TaxID=768533 RepID=A0ABW5DKU7_9HYPH